MLPSIFRNNVFDDFFADPFDPMPALLGGHDPFFGKRPHDIMKTDIRDCDDHYEVDMDLPGFKKEDVQIQLKDGYLKIQAASTQNNDEKDKDGRYLRQERFTGSCSRSFYVGELKPEDIAAKFEDGILKLTLPKQAPQEIPQAHTIAID